jgi:hypothetical protein
MDDSNIPALGLQEIKVIIFNTLCYLLLWDVGSGFEIRTSKPVKAPFGKATDCPQFGFSAFDLLDFTCGVRPN